MSIILNTNNAHDKGIVDNFNKITNHFGDDELLEIILTNWCDDSDIKDITEHLKNRLLENNIPID